MMDEALAYERARHCLYAVIAALGGEPYQNTAARDVIAAAIREAVQAERDRCERLARDYAAFEISASEHDEPGSLARMIREGTPDE